MLDSHMNAIGGKIEALRAELQADRRITHENRVAVAEHLGDVVKRAELERQIDRVMMELRAMVPGRFGRRIDDRMGD